MNLPSHRIELDVKLMKGSGYALSVISRLLSENASREAGDDQPFLNNFSAGGLHEAIRIIADQLSDTGERLEELIRQQATASSAKE